MEERKIIFTTNSAKKSCVRIALLKNTNTHANGGKRMSETRNYGIDLAQKKEYQKALFYLEEAFRHGDYIASNDIGVR